MNTLRKTNLACAFTLIELLMVIAMLSILLAMLVPTLKTSLERGKISRCQNTVQQIAVALNHYVADNSGHLTDTGTDYEMVQWWHENAPDPNGYVDYRTWYGMNNLISEYLGLPNTMPGFNHQPNWNWGLATYSQYKAFRCVSAYGLTSPYSPMPDCAWGYETPEIDCRSRVCGFYPQNIQSYEKFPMTSKFTAPDKALIVYEKWGMNGNGSGGDASTMPYNTHWRVGPRGPEGIGRSAIYGDFHVGFIPSGSDQPRTQRTVSGSNTLHVWGNEMGWEFTAREDEKQYIDWFPRCDSAWPDTDKKVRVDILRQGWPGY